MDVAQLRTIADYQFGPGAGAVLLPEGEHRSLTRTSSGRPRQIHVSEGRIGTYGTDGRLRLGPVGGQRLSDRGERYRVVVGAESVPHVRAGRNAFAKFVTDVDDAIRPRDEVFVEHDDTLIGVGRAELPARGMRAFETGVAVYIRDGADG